MADQATKSLSDVNKSYWDENADKVFDQEWVKVLTKLATRVLQEHTGHLGLSKDTPRSAPVKMLDYACGNGLASWALAPYVDIIRGIDIAPGMVTQYNNRALEAGLPPSTMSAVAGNILEPSPELQTPDMTGFDVAVTCMALHHFEKPEETVRALVDRLSPGGAIAAIDWLPSKGWPPNHDRGHEDGEKHVAHGTINKAVLSPENVLTMLEAAGCDMSTAYYIVVGEKSHIPEDIVKMPDGVMWNMFLALGKKKTLEA
ncbi:hypothetical protein jhhlp_002643 [Lomentospora prolificans]|uniref:Methyltransferase type 12 domain-containing protein n=1 Tax=Lomentospora prolificans TaxID=41688 RepID=A0A2N3NEM4_9PEZI|nr:hypothetical protein jhhlp_002643 [Lomentospora prolificans]